VNNGVNVGRKRGGWSWWNGGDGRLFLVRGGLVIIGGGGVVVRANESEVNFTVRGCCFCVKVNVGEEEATSAVADGG
jgi:hypothetical protein